MKALVTGGCGFIGSHLVGQLIDMGHEVRVIDDLSSGRLENIANFKANNRFQFTKGSVCDKRALANAAIDIDWCFHLAGKADIVPSIEDPELYFRVNVSGTLNVLEAARLAGVKKFIYAASSSSYGIPSVYPTPECSAILPQYPYALTKYMGEELVMHWSKIYSIPAISLRLFNVYGPRSRSSGAYGAVFGVFLAQKLKDLPYTVVGDGEQSRDFTYVSDVVNAFISAVQSSISNEVLNVGSGNHYTINYLTDLLGGQKIYIPKRPGEPNCTFANIEKIKVLLGWSPKVSFEDGVEKMKKDLSNWSDAPIWDAKKIESATKSWFKYLS